MDDLHEFRYFDWLDYTVFAGMLIFSALIGVYFAFFADTKQNTTSEYLVGSKKMGIFPISMSLMASYTSGIVLLGYPSEIYTYGTQMWVTAFAEVLTAVVVTIVYIPVFYNLQIYSSYEYLNKRFNSTVRSIGSFLFLCKMLLYIPIVIYVPAMAFAQVTGLSLNVLIPSVCIVCIFYTSVGGIKAVVWTDTLQMVLMVLGVIVVAVLGTKDVGGVKNIYYKNYDSGRIEFFNTSWDPTIRYTFWNLLIGKFFYHLASCTINQAMVQRCLAMPTISKANITIGIFAIGTFLLCSLCFYTGLVIYAGFADCDPITIGVITKADQLLPYFVMKVTSNIPAIPGIFVAGVFSAALSTMSTGLNSMSGVIMEDFVKPIYKNPLPDERASFYMKIITVLIGTICTSLAFIVDKLGGIIQASGSLGGITAGTLLGMFTLGMLFPWANATGAIAGGAAAAGLVGWISIGSQLALHNQRIVFPTKPVSILGCDNSSLANYYNKQSQILDVPDVSLERVFPLYTVSFTYYAAIGMVTAILVGIIVSWLTGFNDPSKMDPLVFSPVIHRFLKNKILKDSKSPKEENFQIDAENPVEQLETLIETAMR